MIKRMYRKIKKKSKKNTYKIGKEVDGFSFFCLVAGLDGDAW